MGISRWLLWMSVDTNINLLENSDVTPGILLHPEYPNSFPWTTVQKKICVLLTLLSNKKFPLQKNYGKTSGDICVYCPHICAYMCAEVSLLSTWRPFNNIARTAKSEQNKRVLWEQPKICFWARISHSSSGRNPKKNSCLCEAVIKYSACPVGNPKQSSKTSFLFWFCSNTGIVGGKVEFLVKSLEME